jgi:predicted transcriptional regulator
MLYVKPNQMKCKELDFLKSFLSTDFVNKLNSNPNYEISLLEEPYTGFGYADLVCVIWDKKMFTNWNDHRNSLVETDIKVLHHLYNCRIYKDTSSIIRELGFTEKVTNLSLKKLVESDLIHINKSSKYKINPINDIFFVKEIITIEAKLHDWNRALSQSINNTYFSSKSFALFPEKIVNSNLINKYSNTDVGIISFDSKYKIIKKPIRQQIPSSLGSWFFNEYIGRTYWKSA